MKNNYLVTGGAGFIGSNYVDRLLKKGLQVTIYDNLSRKGAKRNIHWLQQKYGQDAFELLVADVRDQDTFHNPVQKADVIIHLASQVAVTSSVQSPREDFEINALGTFNVIEAARTSRRDPVLLYSSTNKVYGGMEDIQVVETSSRWQYANLPFGCPETQRLDFHSPYGCSKGAGDQYVRDYARIYGLRSVVLRQSCIYGPRQFGMEDQGWLAWMIIAAITGKQISIYGDGKQVRDILFVDDLLDAYDSAISGIDEVKGKVFNIGGGKDNVISIWHEFGPILESHLGKRIDVLRGDWRPGDQKVFVSDIRKAEKDLGWTPKTNVESGIKQLFDWVISNRDLF
ncbi:SDR family NAD(P)-dependent oxidoreductase [Chloroflexota bacterium]